METEFAAGTRNLLVNCAGLAAGDRLLVIRESAEYGFYDASLCKQVISVAAALGIGAIVRDVPFAEIIDGLDAETVDQMRASDCTLFLARLGDQIRFRDLPDGCRCIVSYALDAGMMASGFGTAHYKGFSELKLAIDAMIAGAAEIELSCPLGTRVSGPGNAFVGEEEADVSIIRFPMSIFAPVPAANFRGRVALSKFLTGTGSNYYHPYTVVFDQTVFVNFERGRITGFDGAAKDVAAANRHYDFVAGKFGIDRDFVHSWHVGMHPGCAYTKPAAENYERWSGGAFGNPRLLHFHTCGDYPPGEISWNVVDPTVRIDGVAVWQDGRLYPDRIPGGADLMARYPCAAKVFANPAQEIGI